MKECSFFPFCEAFSLFLMDFKRSFWDSAMDSRRNSISSRIFWFVLCAFIRLSVCLSANAGEKLRLACAEDWRADEEDEYNNCEEEEDEEEDDDDAVNGFILLKLGAELRRGDTE